MGENKGPHALPARSGRYGRGGICSAVERRVSGTQDLSGQAGSSQPSRGLSSLPYGGSTGFFGVFAQTNEQSGTSHRVFPIKAPNFFFLSSITVCLEEVARQDPASFPVLTTILTFRR